MDFAKIFEYVTSPMCIAEPLYPNNLVYVNRAYCELTGYTSEELIGTNPGKLLQRNGTFSKRVYMREKLNKTEPVDVLVKNFRKDGTWYWNSLHIHPVIENGICIYWVGMSKDVTQYVEEMNSGLEAVINNLKDSFHQI